MTESVSSDGTLSTSGKKPFYEVVAETLIQQIEAGTAPWQKPWSMGAGIGFMPINPSTGNSYRGINAIHLMAQGRADSRWLTYKQAQAMGAQVKKAERGTQIQYWKFEDLKPATDPTGKPIKDDKGQTVHVRIKLESPRVFYATVFNAEQIDGLPELVAPTLNWDPIERAEQILTNSGAVLHHKAMDRAYYSVSQDEIHLPLKAQFDGAANYYATALHELAHWSGHETRLQRDLEHPFGSEGYAREELRAEIASLMISSELGLPHDPGRHASYVGSWIKVLQKDPLEIFRAAADAQKIHTFITGMEPKLNQTVDVQDADIPLSVSARSVPVPIVQRMTEAAVLAEVDKHIHQFMHQPTVVVRPTAKGVLPGARDSDAISGAVHDGRIFLFLDQLRGANDVGVTLFHELLHYGLRKIFSREQFTSEMLKLYQRDAAIKEFADQWATTNEGIAAKKFDGTDYALARGVDEALARLAEPNAGEFIKADIFSRTIQNVTGWLAEIAQSMGFDGAAAELRGIKNQEARALIKKVFHRLETDTNPTFEGSWESTDAAYSKRQNLDVTSSFTGPNISSDIAKDSPMSSEDQIEKPSNTASNTYKLSRDDLREAFMRVIDDLSPEQALAIGEAIEFTDEDVSAEIASMILKAREKGWMPGSDVQQQDAGTADEFKQPNSLLQPELDGDEADTELEPRNLYNDLNLDGLAQKRIRDHEQTRKEMGLGEEPSDSSGIDNEAQHLNGVFRIGPSINTTFSPSEEPELGIYQVHQKLAREYQFDGAGKYYFRENQGPQLAFEDRGTEVLTPHHSPEVVASVAMLIHSKGWKDLNLKGTTEFKREMWLQASLLGLNASGYEPEPIDLVKLNERRATLSADRSKAQSQQLNVVQNGLAQTLEPTLNVQAPSMAEVVPAGAVDLGAQKAGALDGQLRAALKDQGANDELIVSKALKALNQKIVSQRTYVGELLDFGAAHYKFDKDEQESYFVKLKTATGEQTVWGVDLSRAMEALQAKGPVNGPIILAFQGAKAVQTSVRKRDTQGKAVGWEPAVVNRNEWFAQSLVDVYAAAKIGIDVNPEAEIKNPIAPMLVTDGKDSEVFGQKNQFPSNDQNLKTLDAPQERVRRALSALGVQDLERETTVVALSELYQSPKFHVGTMLAHGQAPYAFQPNGQSSYYARLSTENGEVLIWGADLARAVRNQVLEGQTVVVAYRGLENVSDIDGATTRRNDWLVAPLKTLHEDAQQGVVHTASNQPKVEAPDFSFMSKRDRQSMEVLAQAMRLAKVPDEIAADTLKQAQGLIQSGPSVVKTAPQQFQIKATPAISIVQRKTAGPSL